jgi:hypothetical protein
LKQAVRDNVRISAEHLRHGSERLEKPTRVMGSSSEALSRRWRRASSISSMAHRELAEGHGILILWFLTYACTVCDTIA